MICEPLFAEIKEEVKNLLLEAQEIRDKEYIEHNFSGNKVILNRLHDKDFKVYIGNLSTDSDTVECMLANKSIEFKKDCLLIYDEGF